MIYIYLDSSSCARVINNILYLLDITITYDNQENEY